MISSQSVADALQYISYYHAPDFIRAMGRAYAMEQSPAARDAIAQILTNSRMCAEGHRPICQDTGIVVVFVKVGMGVRFEASRDLEAMINEGVRRAYLNPDNKLRASIVADPAGKRTGTKDNTPAVIHTEFGPGRRARDHRGGQGRRIGEQIHVRHAESVGFGGGLGGGEGAGDGRRLVSPGHARSRHRRQRRESHAAREKIPHGPDRHRRSHRSRAGQQARGAAPGNLQAGQRAGDRRAGARRPYHRARREGIGLSHACRVAPGGGDSELRRHPPPAFHPGWFGTRACSSPRTSPNGRTCAGARTRARAASRSTV